MLSLTFMYQKVLPVFPLLIKTIHEGKCKKSLKGDKYVRVRT